MSSPSEGALRLSEVCSSDYWNPRGPSCSIAVLERECCGAGSCSGPGKGAEQYYQVFTTLRTDSLMKPDTECGGHRRAPNNQSLTHNIVWGEVH